jgi:hypothetical protein
MPLSLNGVVRPGRMGHKLITVLACLVLSSLLVLPAGCQRTLKGAGGEVIPATPPAGRLQEVAPPPAVQQLQEALADRDPRVTIEAPKDGATLPLAGSTLVVRVRDWPLVDAGRLGLGPHLVVQVDDQPPLRLTEHRTTPAGDLVEVGLPTLVPGSHRITAYAALPWGEAVKNPGASARLRVQVLAGNPLTLPPPGTPELVVVSPSDGSRHEPVLLDWLLYDAPLQHLSEGDDSWRLRVNVNGDAFLLDQNVPLWLTGWNPGSNALLIELLDGRGAPLNPPFNSLVRVVSLAGSEKPRWLSGSLAPDELAVLLGEAPPPPLEPQLPEDRNREGEVPEQIAQEVLEPPGEPEGSSEVSQDPQEDDFQPEDVQEEPAEDDREHAEEFMEAEPEPSPSPAAGP